jgi:hypothetical protein
MQRRHAVAALALALLLSLPAPALASGHVTELQSGGTHWIGQVVVDDGYPPTAEAELRRNDRTVTTVTTDGDGRLRFDTADLPTGEYRVVVGSATYARFDLERQTIDAEVTTRRALADGETFSVEVYVTSNRNAYPLQLALVDDVPAELAGRVSNADLENGTPTVAAKSATTITINVDGFPNGTHPVRLTAADSTAATTVRLRVSSNTCQWGTPVPLDAGGAIAGETGGTYWQGQTVAFRAKRCGRHAVQSAAGENLTRVGTGGGRIVVNTTDFPAGEYVVRRPDGGVAHEFTVADAALSASANATHVVVTSNRTTYPLVVRASDRTAGDLAAALDGVVVRDGRAVVPDAARRTVLRVNRSAASPPLELRFGVTDTGESVRVTYSPGAAATPTPTATATSTATPTPSPAPTPTATDDAGGTDDGGPLSGVSTPGFGALPALAALVVVAAAGVRRRRRRRGR